MSGAGGELLGNNVFIYCFNNPVNMSDSSGHWPQWIKNTVKWVAENIVNPVVKTIQKELSEVEATCSRGINISGTLGAIVFDF